MSNFRAHVALTKNALMLGNYGEAEELVVGALREGPTHFDTLYLFGLVALAKRNYTAARHHIDRAYEERLWVEDRVYLPLSVELLGAACRAQPDWEWARYQLARERWRFVGADLTQAVRLLADKTGRVPSFVQVGANDGWRGDPLHDMVAAGELKGLLIEPQAEPFAKLREHYADIDGLAFEKSAVTEEPGPVQMLTAVDRMTIGSFMPERGMLARFDGETRTVEVEGKTFDTILEEHGFDGFDVLQIDTEGYDYNVLKQVDLVGRGVKVVNMEYYLLTMSERVATIKYLESQDFVFTCTYMDLFAIHRPTLGDDFHVTDLLA